MSLALGFYFLSDAEPLISLVSLFYCWRTESGIIIFNVKSGELTKKARLEVLLDDGYWPAFSTVRAPGHKAEWEHVGEGFLKELDFGRVWLRLNVADEGDKDEVIGEWKGDAKPFLQQTLVRDLVRNAVLGRRELTFMTKCRMVSRGSIWWMRRNARSGSSILRLVTSLVPSYSSLARVSTVCLSS